MNASRYVLTTAGLWFGCVAYACRFIRVPQVAVLALAAWLFIYGAILAERVNQDYVAVLRNAKEQLARGNYDPAILAWLNPNVQASRRIIELTKRYGFDR
jgi:hypothetical protein